MSCKRFSQVCRAGRSLACLFGRASLSRLTFGVAPVTAPLVVLFYVTSFSASALAMPSQASSNQYNAEKAGLIPWVESSIGVRANSKGGGYRPKPKPQPKVKTTGGAGKKPATKPGKNKSSTTGKPKKNRTQPIKSAVGRVANKVKTGSQKLFAKAKSLGKNTGTGGRKAMKMNASKEQRSVHKAPVRRPVSLKKGVGAVARRAIETTGSHSAGAGKAIKAKKLGGQGMTWSKPANKIKGGGNEKSPLKVEPAFTAATANTGGGKFGGRVGKTDKSQLVNKLKGPFLSFGQ